MAANCNDHARSSSCFCLFFNGSLGPSKPNEVRRAQLITKHAPPSMLEIVREIPQELFEFWQRVSREEFPNIPGNISFYTRSAVGLVTYFQCIQMVGYRQTTLPSKAAHSVWCAWLAWDLPSLIDFCRKHFGQHIPYTPINELLADDDDARLRTWVANCLLDGIKCNAKKVPSLFSLDLQLGMPLGLGYQRIRKRRSRTFNIYHCNLNRRGQSPWRMSFWYIHSILSKDNLLCLKHKEDIRAPGGACDDDEEDQAPSKPRKMGDTSDLRPIQLLAQVGEAVAYWAILVQYCLQACGEADFD